MTGRYVSNINILSLCSCRPLIIAQFRVYRWGEIEILKARDTPPSDYLHFTDVEVYDAKINGETKIVKVYKDREAFSCARSILKLVR